MNKDDDDGGAMVLFWTQGSHHVTVMATSYRSVSRKREPSRCHGSGSFDGAPVVSCPTIRGKNHQTETRSSCRH